MIRKLLSFALLLGLALPSFSQVPTLPPTTSDTVGASSNKTTGIELPADQNVKYDEGFVTLQAICKGEVKWLVISATKIKYFTLPTGNTIIISIPPQGGLITVFAVGLVDNKLTEFARTSITVNGGATPITPPGPNPPGPSPNPPVASAHVTFVVDLNATTPALGQILNSQKVREAITTRGAYYRLYDANSSVLKEKGLDKVVVERGGPPMIIVQAANGNVVGVTKIPGTEAEVLQYLTKVLGGQ